MKKALTYALCLVLLSQATCSSAFDIAQKWHSMDAKHKRWIQIIGGCALAAGSIYLTGLGISHVRSEFNKSNTLFAEGKALHQTMLPELVAKVQTEELAWQHAVTNAAPQQETNSLYMMLLKDRAYLSDVMSGKPFHEEKMLYWQANVSEPLGIFCGGLLCFALGGIYLPLQMAYDAYIEQE
jgi:hypothetical protein